MNLEKLKAILVLLPPLASINITFPGNAEGIIGLRRLRNLHSNSKLRIHGCERLITTILMSDDWGSIEDNRTFQVSFPLLSLREEAVTHLYDYIERVSPPQDTILSQLLSRREKMRDNANRDISEQLISIEFHREVSDWGLRINCGHRLWHELPQIYVHLLEDDAVIAELVLDATTGCIIEGNEMTVAFTDIGRAQRRVRALLTKYIERLERCTS